MRGCRRNVRYEEIRKKVEDEVEDESKGSWEYLRDVQRRKEQGKRGEEERRRGQKEEEGGKGGREISHQHDSSRCAVGKVEEDEHDEGEEIENEKLKQVNEGPKEEKSEKMERRGGRRLRTRM